MTAKRPVNAGRPWTSDDLATLERMRSGEGRGFEDIGAELGRTVESCKTMARIHEILLPRDVASRNKRRRRMEPRAPRPSTLVDYTRATAAASGALAAEIRAARAEMNWAPPFKDGAIRW